MPELHDDKKVLDLEATSQLKVSGRGIATLRDCPNAPKLFMPVVDGLYRALPDNGTVARELRGQFPNDVGHAHWSSTVVDRHPEIYVPMHEYINLLRKVVADNSLAEDIANRLHPQVKEYYLNEGDLSLPAYQQRLLQGVLFYPDHAWCLAKFTCAPGEAWRHFKELVLDTGPYTQELRFDGSPMPHWYHGELGTDFDLKTEKDYFHDENARFEFNIFGDFPEGGQKAVAAFREMVRVLSVLQQSGYLKEIDLRAGTHIVLRPSWIAGEPIIEPR